MSSSGPALDLFGQPIPADTAEIAAREYPYETCWEDCDQCGTFAFVQTHKDPRFREFRLCNHPLMADASCWESSGVCELYVRPAPAPKPKPVAPGWEDY